MLKLEDCRVVFIMVGLVGVLMFASPWLGLVLHFPSGEKFSELSILGPGHMAEDYPFNVSAGESYEIYVGVGNHMGSSVYYVVEAKFKNQTEPLPDAANGTPTSSAPLFESRVFLGDNDTWEEKILFSFEGVSFENNSSRVSEITINSNSSRVDKTASWDQAYKGFYYQLYFELWIYNTTTSVFQYHNRRVGIELNMTAGI